MGDLANNVRGHARDIQEMIGQPPEDGKLYIYRKLVEGDYEEDGVTGCAVFVPSMGAPFAQVQRVYHGDEHATVKLTHGAYITATELAVFLGLGWTVPAGMGSWLRQTIDLPAQTAEGLGFPPAQTEVDSYPQLDYNQE